MKKYIKQMILIFSLIFSIIFLLPVADEHLSKHKNYAILTNVVASEVSEPVLATAGDASYLTKERTLNDIYIVNVLILFVLLFWVLWNIIRVLYRIITDFKNW